GMGSEFHDAAYSRRFGCMVGAHSEFGFGGSIWRARAATSCDAVLGSSGRIHRRSIRCSLARGATARRRRTRSVRARGVMTRPPQELTIDEYLRKRLMPVEGAIPQLPGIDMYGNSIPAGAVGGDLFEYINFQQRYDINARIERALKRSKEYVEVLP